MAKRMISPKTLQYLMGHSDIGVTMNVYTHLNLDYARVEVERVEAMRELEKIGEVNHDRDGKVIRLV